MSLIREAQLEKFKNSGAIQSTLLAIDSATETAELFFVLTNKLDELATSLAFDVAMINEYDQQGEIQSLESLVETVHTKLEVFEDLKLLVKVDELAKILKVKKEKAKSKKEDVAKSLGL